MLDAQVARRQDAELAKLPERFVCAQVAQFFDVDLNHSPCDFDRSWHVFLLNADGTIDGRHGSRSSSDAHENLVLGLNRALARAVELLAGYPRNRTDSEAK